MRRFSSAVMFFGLVILIIALSSDVAVEGYRGQRINNHGLMQSQLINTILGVAVLLGGLLLKVFGKNINEGEYFQGIDKLPPSEYWARWITAILAAVCVWVLLVMYFWPNMLAAALLLGSFAACVFMPQATYTVLKRVWMVLMLLAAVLLIVHLFAVATTWINYLTLSLFSDGVHLVGSGSIPVVLGTLVVVPLVISIMGFLVARRKEKLA